MRTLIPLRKIQEKLNSKALHVIRAFCQRVFSFQNNFWVLKRMTNQCRFTLKPDSFVVFYFRNLTSINGGHQLSIKGGSNTQLPSSTFENFPSSNMPRTSSSSTITINLDPANFRHDPVNLFNFRLPFQSQLKLIQGLLVTIFFSFVFFCIFFYSQVSSMKLCYVPLQDI